MTTDTPRRRPERERPSIGVGDTVGILLVRYDRAGNMTGTSIPVKGVVERLYNDGPNTKQKAGVRWENGRLGYLYTGKNGWEYVHNLTLVKRKK